jgi:Zn-dependent alcohol dehydrogenases
MQISKGLSVHGWPSGHAMDSEETIQFTELENIKCMVQEYPLEKANEAFGRSRLRLRYNTSCKARQLRKT